MAVAIVGGTGLYRLGLLGETPKEERIETPFGPVVLQVGEYAGVPLVFLARHGTGHTVPPHRVNYRANMWALRKAGVRRVIATAASGSLNPAMKPGELVLVDQFLDFTKDRPTTFFDGEGGRVVHLDMTDPYCPDVRRRLAEAAAREGIPIHDGGVYVCAEGPRYETRAEIHAFRLLGGDVVGMTGVPEVVLAREAGLCYASVALVTNMAAGLSPDEVTHDAVTKVMAANLDTFQRMLTAALDRWAEPGSPRGEETGEPACSCRRLAEEAGAVWDDGGGDGP